MTGQAKSTLLILSILAVAACSGSAEPNGASGAATTADEAVIRVARGLAAGRPEVVWQALPASYQKDVTELVHSAAGKMDAELWDRTFGVLGKFSRVLGEKRELILSHPMVAGKITDEADAHRSWDAVVGLFDVLVQSDLAELDRVQRLDIERFLAETGGKLMRQLAAASALTADNTWARQMDNLEQAKATVVSSSGRGAVVRLEVPGEEPKVEAYVRVEGKWVPEQMAEQWDAEIAKARESLSGFAGDESPEKRQTAMMQLAMIEGVLDGVLAAKTPEQFNASVGAILGMAMNAARTPAQPPTVVQVIEREQLAEIPGIEPVVMITNSGVSSEPARERARQSYDPDAVPIDRAGTYVGRPMRVLGEDGLDFTGRLVAADGGVLEFERRLISGTVTFHVRTREIRSLRFHNR